MMVGLLLLLHAGTLSAQSPAHIVYDRVILGGHVMDPASNLDGPRNIGLLGGRIAVITRNAIQGRDTIDARGGGLVIAPGFIDLNAHGQTPETYRFYALDGVATAPIARRRRRRLARSPNASRSDSARARSASAPGFLTRRRQRALSCSPCSASPRRPRRQSTCTFVPASKASRKRCRSRAKPVLHCMWCTSTAPA